MEDTYLFPAERREIIFNFVSKYYDVPLEDIVQRKNRRERREAVHARWVVMGVMHKHMGYSAAQIARFVGCNHTTVLRSLKKIKDIESFQRVIDLTARTTGRSLSATLCRGYGT